MRMIFRSIAMLALAVCASAVLTMPASASVPIDPGLCAVVTSGPEHPAMDQSFIRDEVAVLPVATTSPNSITPGRSSATAERMPFADKSITAAAYQHIDPDIAG